MSDLPRSDSRLPDAFLRWASPREAPFGEAEKPGASRSNLRGQWLRMMALVYSIAIHLALLLGLTVAVPRKPEVTTGGRTYAARLQLRFIETGLHAHAHPASAVAKVVKKQPVIITSGVAQATKDEKVAPIAAAADVVAIPQVTQAGKAPPRSDDWHIEPRNKRNTGADAGDYVQPRPQADANVMKHSTGGVTYRPTRFDSSWVPDSENAVRQAIDRATFHSTIKLPFGMSINCASGPSSSETLATTVPVVPIASTNCRGTSPPAPMAAKALIDIQTLGSAQPLEDQAKPRRSAASPGDSTNAAKCAAASAAGCRCFRVASRGRCPTPRPARMADRAFSLHYRTGMENPPIESRTSRSLEWICWDSRRSQDKGATGVAYTSSAGA